MGTRMLARRTFTVTAAAGQDNVFAGVWLPPGSVVHGVSGYCVLEATSVDLFQKALLGSLEGWVFNLDDIDNMGVMDTEWDIHVPKDTAIDAIDLDVAGSDTAPFYEPGKITWEFLFPIGRTPQRVFQRRWISSAGHNSRIVNQDPETPFGFQFVAGLTVPVRMNKPFKVEDPSLLAFAVASPNTLTTSATAALAAIVENEWGQLRYIDHVMERAMLDLIGLTEAGAETPFEEATLLLKKVLDPAMLESAAGTWVNTTWRCTGEMVFDIEVEGSMEKAVLTTGR